MKILETCNHATLSESVIYSDSRLMTNVIHLKQNIKGIWKEIMVNIGHYINKDCLIIFFGAVLKYNFVTDGHCYL